MYCVHTPPAMKIRNLKWREYTLVSLILKKISKIDATRCQISRLKCTKINFGWGSSPDPAGGAYSAPVVLLLRGRRGRGREEEKEREGRGGGGEGKGGKGRTTLHTPCRKFLATPLTGLLLGSLHIGSGRKRL